MLPTPPLIALPDTGILQSPDAAPPSPQHVHPRHPQTMQIHPHSVALVVDGEFGSRMLSLGTRIRVWAVDSPANRRVVGRMNAKDRSPEMQGGVTLVEADPDATRAQTCLEMLYGVEAGGTYAANPPYSEIEVIGVDGDDADAVQGELARMGFEAFEPTSAGFRARRRIRLSAL